MDTSDSGERRKDIAGTFFESLLIAPASCYVHALWTLNHEGESTILNTKTIIGIKHRFYAGLKKEIQNKLYILVELRSYDV